jgi:hypothetical protein
MDHRTFMAGLDPEARAALVRRSDAPGLWHLATHAGAILGCAVLIGSASPFWWLFLPVQGVLIVFLRQPLAERGGRACGGVPHPAALHLVQVLSPRPSPLDQS